METYHVLLYHAVHSHIPHACCEECLEFTPFGQFFRLERDAVSRFFKSLQIAKIKICSCTALQLLQWLAGISVVRFYYFLTNLRASNAYKTAFIEGG